MVIVDQHGKERIVSVGGNVRGVKIKTMRLNAEDVRKLAAALEDDDKQTLGWLRDCYRRFV